MINPKDLRINNLVFPNKQRKSIFIIEGVRKPFNQNKNAWIVSGRDIYNRHKATPSQNINPFPIPITEGRLLELLGFERMNYGVVSFPTALRINDDGDKLFLDRFGEIRIYSNCDTPSTIMLPHIKYIHQVQNLIYALSEFELDFDSLAVTLGQTSCGA